MMRFLTVYLLLLPFLCPAQKKRVWIDTDIMIGKFKHDVDDGLALLMLLQDTSIAIEGISFVHGVNYAEKVTTKLLHWYAPTRDIPMFKGADDAKEFGKRTQAVDAIIAALEAGPITVFALGPFTNLGTVLNLRPDLHSNIEIISYCAGRRPGMLFNPGSGKVRFRDYNFDLDPEATAEFLSADVPVLLAGYDCSDSLFLNIKDFDHLKNSASEGDRWLFRQLKSWLGLWRGFIGSEKGFIPFDCATVGALLHPNEFTIISQIPVYMKDAPDDTKGDNARTLKPYLLVDEQGSGRSVSYCEYTTAAFKQRLLKTLNHPDYR